MLFVLKLYLPSYSVRTTVWLECLLRSPSYWCATKKRGFDVSFKLKVLEEAKIPHEMVRKKRFGGEKGAW